MTPFHSLTLIMYYSSSSRRLEPVTRVGTEFKELELVIASGSVHLHLNSTDSKKKMGELACRLKKFHTPGIDRCFMF